MDLKKIGKALLFPHKAIMALLTPIAILLLALSAVVWETNSLPSIISYVVSAYTLTVWCFRVPHVIEWWKITKNENKYLHLWRNDARLRVNVALYSGLAWNAIYGVFQLCLGFYHHTFWFYSLGAYYICLAVMRLLLASHTSKFTVGERMRDELLKYCFCGWALLLMNLALALIIFFMVYWDRTFEHHMITAIAMAAYTFTAFTFAIINVVKYKKYNSPVFSVSKIISLAAALVSMLTLESTMLTTFADETMSALDRKIMLGATGGVICALILSAAIFIIVSGTRKLKILKAEMSNGK